MARGERRWRGDGAESARCSQQPRTRGCCDSAFGAKKPCQCGTGALGAVAIPECIHLVPTEARVESLVTQCSRKRYTATRVLNIKKEKMPSLRHSALHSRL